MWCIRQVANVGVAMLEKFEGGDRLIYRRMCIRPSSLFWCKWSGWFHTKGWRRDEDPLKSKIGEKEWWKTYRLRLEDISLAVREKMMNVEPVGFARTLIRDECGPLNVRWGRGIPFLFIRFISWGIVGVYNFLDLRLLLPIRLGGGAEDPRFPKEDPESCEWFEFWYGGLNYWSLEVMKLGRSGCGDLG